MVPSQVSKLNRMPQKMARAGGYSRLPALILASVVEASANNFMAVLATSLYRAAVVMVGAAGQRIRTAGGASAGSTSSTLRVSPDWLMVPLPKPDQISIAVDRGGWSGVRPHGTTPGSDPSTARGVRASRAGLSCAALQARHVLGQFLTGHDALSESSISSAH